MPFRGVMDRFLSSATNRIDSKGRVSVPAPFRAIIQKRGFADLYALRSLDDPAMDVGGPDYLEAFEKRIAQEDPFLRTAEDMSFFIHGDGTFLKIDQDGRVTMTDFVREHTHITDEATFVGRGHFFQIWEPSRFRTHCDAVRARLSAARRAAMETSPNGVRP